MLSLKITSTSSSPSQPTGPVLASSTSAEDSSCFDENEKKNTINHPSLQLTLSSYLISFFVIWLVVISFFALSYFIKSRLPNSAFLDYSNIQFLYKNNLTSLKPFDDALKGGPYNVILDGHCHSTLSDGEMTPEQLIEWGIASGYNAMIVTDHNTVDGGLQAREIARKKYPGKMIVIVGLEYSCCRIHMNLINIEKEIPMCGKGSAVGDRCPFPTDQQLKDTIDLTHTMGGAVIVNHIPWSMTRQAGRNVSRLPDHPSIEKLMEWGVDGIEIVNGVTFDATSYEYMKNKAEEENRHFIVLTGSDVHVPQPAFAWTIFEAPTPLTEKGVWNALKQGPTSFLYLPHGLPSPYPEISEPEFRDEFSNAVGPFLSLNEFVRDNVYSYRHGMYSFQRSFCHPTLHEVYFIPILVTLTIILFLILFGLGLHALLYGYLFRRTLWYKVRHASIKMA